MKTKTLRQIAITVTPANEDAISELLLRELGAPAAVFHDLEADTRHASVYVELPEAALRAKRADLGAALRRLIDCGVDARNAHITFRKLKPQDWAESWKRHFKPISIGKSLLVKPSWSRRKPAAGAKVIILDPGLSFGTGQHPTTRFCLEQLAAARVSGTAQSFLDMGSGTGILAMGASKLGYQPVEAFDFDPAAVRIANDNARRNEITNVKFARRDLTTLPSRSSRRFTVVCANLTHDLLIGEARRIANRLAPSGWLILAGILNTQFSGVAAAYRKLGGRCTARRTEGEWTSGVFRI